MVQLSCYVNSKLGPVNQEAHGIGITTREFRSVLIMTGLGHSSFHALTLPGLGFFELEKIGGEGQFDPRLSFSTKKVIWSLFLVYEFLTPK